MSTTKVTRAEAEATLAAIIEQFKVYIEPMTLDSGTVLPGDPPPVLLEGFDGRDWTIMWEMGPDEWVFALDGDPTEEERALAADASEEFGVTVPVAKREPAKIPATVMAEPINHYSLGLYRA